MSKDLIKRLLDNRVTGFNLTVAAVEAAERIEWLEQQLAAAQEALENEQAKGIHSCHANCTMDGCVNRKLREQLAAALAAIKAKDAALKYASQNYMEYDFDWQKLLDALAIQPDDSALNAWLGQPVAWYSKTSHAGAGGLWSYKTDESDVPLYAPKGMTK